MFKQTRATSSIKIAAGAAAAAAAGDEAEADEAEADDAAGHFQLVAKLTNTNPTVVRTYEGRSLDKGRSNQTWPAGAEAAADGADADDAAASFQLVAFIHIFIYCLQEKTQTRPKD